MENSLYFKTGYPEMGRALNHTGRPIVYSCSWPAYLIDQPELVDYAVISKHCNLWAFIIREKFDI